MNRLDFLKKTSLALAGGLLVGDAALEAFERLTHKKVFALGGMPEISGRATMILAEQGFRVGDHVALISSGSYRNFGVITSVNHKPNGGVNIVWNGGIGGGVDDLLVHGNAVTL